MKQYAHRSRWLHRLCMGFSWIWIGASLAWSSPFQAPAPVAQTAENRLRIVIVGGDEPLRNLKQRVAREVIVEVRDENDRPVGAGAAVTLALTSRGGSPLATGVTAANGRVALSFTPGTTGSTNVNIGATLGGQSGAV